MKVFIAIICVLVLLPFLLFAGGAGLSRIMYNHTYHNYDYTKPEITVSDITFIAELYGDWTNISEDPYITEKHNPYRFRICRKWEDRDLLRDKKYAITVSSLKVGEKVLKDTESTSIQSPCSGYTDLNIPNHNEKVTITGHITLDKQVKPFSLTLNPNYWEQKTHTLWEGIMGI